WTTFAGVVLVVSALVLISPPWITPASAAEPSPPPATASPPAGKELQVEVTKKGLGKEVSIKKGNKEWFMLIEVTPENTVVVRQEKENETYLVDESETHDRPMTQGEVDVAIEDFINSVKTQVNRK
ncbi:MAG TPA: hypothetical protein VFL31_02520, partial [Nitrospiraceae bacterium]|nr:hypothetical protein [Nitrospiraceae bacterium]